MRENILAIQKLVEWINRNPEKIPSATEAAQNVGYERSYLSKLFKKTTGISYNAYSSITKLGFAAAVLRDTEKTITEIAEMLDYSGPEAFTHAFTKAYGCCPSNFRKNPDSISVPFFRIICNENKGVITMKRIDPASVIGDNFLTLLELHPASIIMYCLLASFAASPTGLLRDYNPKRNTIPCIEIDSSVAKILPLPIDEIFLSIIDLADVDLLTIVRMEKDTISVILNPIPENLVSNGLIDNISAL